MGPATTPARHFSTGPCLGASVKPQVSTRNVPKFPVEAAPTIRRRHRELVCPLLLVELKPYPGDRSGNDQESQPIPECDPVAITDKDKDTEHNSDPYHPQALPYGRSPVEHP